MKFSALNSVGYGNKHKRYFGRPLNMTHTWYWLRKWISLGLYTISKVSDSIGIIKLIPVSVSERQRNNTFNNTFHNDINKYKCYFDPKVTKL